MFTKMINAVLLVGLGFVALWYFGFLARSTNTMQAAPRLLVINVLDKALYDDAHIKGSVQIDSDKVEAAARAWDKNSTIVIYCANYMCSSSREIAKKLTALGFTQVKAYEGGTAEWYELSQKDPSYQLEGPTKESYLKRSIKPPAEHASGVAVITAQELKSLLVAAGV